MLQIKEEHNEKIIKPFIHLSANVSWSVWSVSECLPDDKNQVNYHKLWTNWHQTLLTPNIAHKIYISTYFSQNMLGNIGTVCIFAL